MQIQTNDDENTLIIHLISEPKQKRSYGRKTHARIIMSIL